VAVPRFLNLSLNYFFNYRFSGLFLKTERNPNGILAKKLRNSDLFAGCIFFNPFLKNRVFASVYNHFQLTFKNSQKNYVQS